MKIILLPLLLVLPTLAAEEVLAPKDEKSAKRSYTIEQTSTTEVEVGTLSFGPDQEQNAGGGSTREQSFVARLDETLLDVAGGRSTRLRREYSAVEEETTTSGQSGDVRVADAGKQASPLQGRSVDFEWDAEDEAWNADWTEGSDGRDAWLGELATFVDLRFALPAEGVDEGARWELDVALLEQLLWPGGRLMVKEPALPDDMPAGAVALRIPNMSSIRTFEEADGELECELESVREQDGRRVAVITIEAKAEISQDIGDLLNEQAERDGDPSQEYDVATLERTLEGEGELIWDIDAGKLVSYTFEAEMATEVESQWSMDVGITFDLAYYTEQNAVMTVSVTPAE